VWLRKVSSNVRSCRCPVHSDAEVEDFLGETSRVRERPFRRSVIGSEDGQDCHDGLLRSHFVYGRLER
jgi:hypothetical protein